MLIRVDSCCVVWLFVLCCVGGDASSFFFFEIGCFGLVSHFAKYDPLNSLFGLMLFSLILMMNVDHCLCYLFVASILCSRCNKIMLRTIQRVGSKPLSSSSTKYVLIVDACRSSILIAPEALYISHLSNAIVDDSNKKELPCILVHENKFVLHNSMASSLTAVQQHSRM